MSMAMTVVHRACAVRAYDVSLLFNLRVLKTADCGVRCLREMMLDRVVAAGSDSGMVLLHDEWVEA